MPSFSNNTIKDAQDYLPSLNAGDKAALEQIYRLCYRDLCFYLHSMLDDAATAEEIADDAFLKLSKEAARHPFSAIEGVWAFLRVVARNAATDHLRKRISLRKQHKGYLFALVNQPSTDIPAADDLCDVYTEVIAQLYTAMKELPEQQREVMRLNQQGLSIAEIAETMNLSPQTVRNYRGKAIKVLKGKLSPIALALLLCHPFYGPLL